MRALARATTPREPQDGPSEDDDRETMALLTRAALDALCLLLGASGGGARRPFGGAHAAALAEQLDTVLEMGGGAAIGRALAAGASDEALVFHGLRVLCALTRPVSGLPEGSQDHPQARAERVTSDGTLGAALLALAAQRASARVQLVGVRLIGQVCEGSESVGSGSARRAQDVCDGGGIGAALAALWHHADSSDVALAASWAIHGICVGEAPAARARGRCAVVEGALVALVGVLRTHGQRLRNVNEAACAALGAIVGTDDAEIRMAAEAAGVRGEWLGIVPPPVEVELQQVHWM